MTKQHIFKKGSTTFFYSSLLFPKHIRRDVFTLYAYVRVIDDAVDQSTPDEKLLEKLWNDSQLAWKGKNIQNPLVSEFIELAKRKEFKWEWIVAFWWAMRQDLSKKSYQTFSELEEYMYGSAEVIGLMMARILNLPKQAQKAAQLQGKAMQLINFIRDIAEDEQLGRKYLPSLTTHPIQKKSVDELIAMYREIQSQAEKGYRFIPYRYLIAIKTAADMYKWTADQISRNPSLITHTKIKPSKFRILIQGIWNALYLWR